MTLEELVGQQLAVGLPGPTLTDTARRMLRRTHAGAVVVFARNFEQAAQFTALRRALEAALGRPLLLMVDHEGGRIIRFASDVTRFPSAEVQGRAGCEAIARQGAVEAEELRALGVSMNLAPCVDVRVAGGDPVIGDRSYGEDPAQVTACALARIRGLQSHGVAACAKHFPGLGAVPSDPHHELPTIALDWRTLEEVHLPPFQAAVADGVAAVMSSHVCYPDLGEPPGLPATFSPRLVTGLLRQRLGFDGVIMTDDLEMGALRRLGGVGEAAVEAVAAGHDIALVCADPAAAEEAFSRLVAGYREGHLSEQHLQTSVWRVAHLRKKYLVPPLSLTAGI